MLGLTGRQSAPTLYPASCLLIARLVTSQLLGLSSCLLTATSLKLEQLPRAATHQQVVQSSSTISSQPYRNEHQLSRSGKTDGLPSTVSHSDRSLPISAIPCLRHLWSRPPEAVVAASHSDLSPEQSIGNQST